VRPFFIEHHPNMIKVATDRLTLIAATAALARADVGDRARFSELLGARVPPSWPTRDVIDVQELFAQWLERGEVEPGFCHWYIVMNGSLCGGTGCFGNPDAAGLVSVGYGIIPEREGQGIATEAFGGLIDWLAKSGRVRTIRATTFERHHASVRILEKNSFTCLGVSPEDGAASDADRRGRGCLMIWQRHV
jgi:[ribosomal protein S5]-alanine N-acetyltransferase